MNSRPAFHRRLEGRSAGRHLKLGLTALGIAGALLGFSVERTRALTTYDREVTCPIGGQKFTTRAVGIYRQNGMRLDSKPLGSLMAPMPFPVCPDNGFVVYKNEFSEAELAELKPIVSSDAYKQARQEHTDHYMAAFMLERLGSSDRHQIASLYLQASWEAEDRKPELVDRYRSLSLQSFDAFLTKPSSRNDQWWSAVIIGADLQRMLGDFDGAEKRLSELPFAELLSGSIANGSIMLNVISQIRHHARNRNAAPERFDEAETVQALVRGALPYAGQ
jgi:hypothetical protein